MVKSVRIALLTDESFSSWFARIVWAHGATPSELYRIAQPGGRIGRIDLDRHACDDLILNLYRHAGIPADALEAITLRRWRGPSTMLTTARPPPAAGIGK